MTIVKIADQLYDEVEWLEARKPLITSSDFFTYLGRKLPSWWSDKPDTIEHCKLNNVAKEFAAEARVSMNHGIHDEDNIREKLGKCLGACTAGDHGLYQNEKWPYLGASIDGWLLYPDESFAQLEKYCQAPDTMRQLIRDIQEVMGFNERILLEVKKSPSKSWLKGVPDYYKAQQQGQMHILDVKANVIVTETIVWLQPKGESRKRQFWDMKAFLTLRNDKFVPALDAMNARWKAALEARGEVSKQED